MITRMVPLLAAALVLLLPGGETARAHSIAPGLLEITEQADGRLDLVWKTSLYVPAGGPLRPTLPADCSDATPRTETLDGESLTTRWSVRCAYPLVGRPVAVEGLAMGKTDALVRIALHDGRRIQGVLRGSEPSLVVPERPRRLDVIGSYARLGIEHILSGPDHLLFVLGLLLLVATPRLLVETITAFTVAHSVTLSLVVLGFVHFPSRAIEVGIAASVFVLAVELTREPGIRTSWMRRAPWAMAGAFGLLHGFGFAGALTETGLPAGEIPLALFAFNVGIELGQLAFTGVAAGVGLLVIRVLSRRPAWLTTGPAYVMGSLSALWCLERTVGLILR